jgi:uncharacterized membrane protein
MHTASKWRGVIIALSSVVLFAYIVTRALTLSLTYDEAWTCKEVLKASYYGIISYKEYMIANNHVLNSIWVKACLRVFDFSVFPLRLLSIIGGLLYIVYVYFITNFFSNSYIKIFAFVLLCFQPFILDYFSLARGYGLALSFLVISVYLLLKKTNKINANYISLSTVFITVAALLNFSFVYACLAIVSVNVGLKLWLNSKTKPIYLVHYIIRLVPEILCLLLVVLYIYPIGKVLSKESFLLASDAGFVRGTLASLLYGITYGTIHGLGGIVIKLIFIITMCLVMPAVLAGRKADKLSDNYYRLLIVITLLLIVICVIYGQYYINKTKYPIERGAIYLLPLLFLIIIFSVDLLINNNGFLSVVSYSCSFLLIISCAYLLVSSWSLIYTFTWPRQAHDKEVVSLVASDMLRNGSTSAILMTDDGSSGFDIYVQQKRSVVIKAVHSLDGAALLSRKYKFIYIYHYSQKSDKGVLRSYADTHTSLLRMSN